MIEVFEIIEIVLLAFVCVSNILILKNFYYD